LHAFRLVDQLVEGIFYMHSKGITHENLGPSNLLLTGHAETLKIVGFSKTAARNACGSSSEINQLRAATGDWLQELAHESRAWMAPEQIRGDQITPSVDVWSCGLCTAFMLLGRHPFSSKTLAPDVTKGDHVLRKAVRSMCKGKLHISQLQGLSHGAIAFLAACLQGNVGRRLCTRELRLHPMLMMHTFQDPELQHQDSLQSSIRQFQSKSLGSMPRLIPKEKRIPKTLCSRTINELPYMTRVRAGKACASEQSDSKPHTLSEGPAARASRRADLVVRSWGSEGVQRPSMTLDSLPIMAAGRTRHAAFARDRAA